ncbi:hypothetical protein NPIL_27141 [Nephila pilipes]|uniref:Uncharacterized protein n=1 Tax=Nephila pilipes TaxID=299642 RepID=A0A8X6UF57_NEPPI|nr:hypothetical protein NPIL_27141 [Nephila pilipes]
MWWAVSYVYRPSALRFSRIRYETRGMTSWRMSRDPHSQLWSYRNDPPWRPLLLRIGDGKFFLPLATMLASEVLTEMQDSCL